MLPDLRFVLGALIATALLGVTLFGLAATMHISYQSKIAPLEASRLLAYTPEGRHRIFDIPAPRADSPFATIPADPNPVPLRQQSLEPATEPTAEPAAEPAAAPVQTAASVPPAPEQPAIVQPASVPSATEPVVVQPANLPPPADDADTVDERAVVDPPLPLDNDAPAQTVETAPAAPLPEPDPEPAAAASAPIEALPAAPAPVVEAPAEPVATPDVPEVGSIPPATDAAPATRRDVAAITEAREAPKARRRAQDREGQARGSPRRGGVEHVAVVDAVSAGSDAVECEPPGDRLLAPRLTSEPLRAATAATTAWRCR